MVTIKDVAEKANVSIATVSRALNNRGYVSEKTRQAIKKAIAELNYSPNGLARNLFSCETKTIGYVVPTVCHPFFSQITQIVEQKLADLGYHMLLCTTDRNQDRESQLIDMLREHRVDGIIIGSHTLNAQKYAQADIPIVAFDTLLDCAQICVSSNHKLGGEMAAERVLQSRCQTVLQVIGNPEARTNARSRHQVFFEKMTQAGITCISVPVSDRSDLDVSTYAEFAQKLLASYPSVDTFFATDLLAIEIVKAAAALGCKVPDDIQVIGYDGSYIAAMSCPTITTVCQPIRELAETIAVSMYGLITGEADKRNIVLDQLFVQEGSTMR